MTGNRCAYGDEDVLAWVLGDAGGSRGQDLALHLAECPSCRERAEEYCALDRSAGACREGAVIRWRAFETPFGRMRAAASRDGLIQLTWRPVDDEAFVGALEDRFRRAPVVCDRDQLEPVEEQLHEYFESRRTRFELPLDLAGLTDFQRSVLDAASDLGFGEVASYTEIARRIGRPRASRAVGNALGRNPIAIVIPCHRVLRSDGSLGGYTGGLEYKEALLDIEGRRDLLGDGQPRLAL